jgi:hypothetical protein
MHFGWNIGGGGGAVNPAYPGIGESWESFYNPIDNGRWVEKHEFYLTPSSFVAAPSQQIRLSSYTIDSTTGGIDYYHTVGRHYYKRPYASDEDSQYFLVQPAGLDGASLVLSKNVTDGLSIVYSKSAGVTISGSGMDTGFDRMIIQGFKAIDFTSAGFSMASDGNTTNFTIKTVTNSAVFDPQTADQVDIGVSNRNFRTGYFKQLGWRTRAGDPDAADVPNGTWQVWKNTTSGVFKLWLNDAGTFKSVALA